MSSPSRNFMSSRTTDAAGTAQRDLEADVPLLRFTVAVYAAHLKGYAKPLMLLEL